MPWQDDEYLQAALIKIFTGCLQHDKQGRNKLQAA